MYLGDSIFSYPPIKENFKVLPMWNRKIISLIFIICISLFFVSSSLLWPLDREATENSGHLPARLVNDKTEFSFRVRALLDYPTTDINTTDIAWDIFKPNLYAARAMRLSFLWEGPVQVSFEGVETLLHNESAEDFINIWYATSMQNPQEPSGAYDDGYVFEGEDEVLQIAEEYSLEWRTPEEINNHPISLPLNMGSNITHISLIIWMKLNIEMGTRVGNYSDRDGFFISVTAKP